MGGTPLGENGGMIDSGPDQRMPEPHRVPLDGDKPRPFGDRAASPVSCSTPAAPAARSTMVRSPVSSAAATSNRVRVGPGSWLIS